MTDKSSYQISRNMGIIKLDDFKLNEKIIFLDK